MRSRWASHPAAGDGATVSGADGLEPSCPRCHGTGTVSVTIGGDGYGDRCCAEMDGEGPCPECEDEPIVEGP